MTELLVLTDDEVALLLEPVALRRALERAFLAISDGKLCVPPRTSTATERGQLLAMPGHIDGAGIAAKLVTIFPDNAARSPARPSHQGLLVLFDPDDGAPLALMAAERLTQERTAAAAALAADLLARKDATELCIVGAGAQARGHLVAFAGLRDWRRIRVWNRTPAWAEALVPLDPRVVLAESLDAALDGADVVALCTHSDTPLLTAAHADALAARGAHVSSVGIGRELPRELLARADCIGVEARTVAGNGPPAGALDLAQIDPAAVVELGELLSGRAAGRTSPSQLTIYKSVGHAAEDVAVAQAIYENAQARIAGGEAIGRHIEL